MNDIINIKNEMIGGEQQQCVDARELWRALGPKTEAAKWIARKIEHTQAVEGEDFTIFVRIDERAIGATTTKVYTITLDLAKHFAMLERTAKGHEIRQYFIEVEKQARKLFQQTAAPLSQLMPQEKSMRILRAQIEAANILGVPTHIGQQEAVKSVYQETGVDYSPLLLAAPAQDDVPAEEKMLEPTEIGRLLDISGRKVNQLIAAEGLQMRVNGTWLPTEKGKRWCTSHAWRTAEKSGYNLKWNVQHVVELLTE